MGYYVYCSSSLSFKEHVSIEKFVETFPKVRELGFDISVYAYQRYDKDSNKVMCVFPDINFEGNYDEEETAEALALIAPFLSENSCVFFDGEDAKWSFDLVEGKFVERNCYEYYETELDQKSQYKIKRQGFNIGLTDEELKDIYFKIGLGKIGINDTGVAACGISEEKS